MTNYYFFSCQGYQVDFHFFFKIENPTLKILRLIRDLHGIYWSHSELPKRKRPKIMLPRLFKIWLKISIDQSIYD